jgi:hypothetical protein
MEVTPQISTPKGGLPRLCHETVTRQGPPDLASDMTVLGELGLAASLRRSTHVGTCR